MYTSDHVVCSFLPDQERWEDNCDVIGLECPQIEPRQSKPIKHKEQQLLTLVFGTVFSILRILGMPVPPLCTHLQEAEHSREYPSGSVCHTGVPCPTCRRKMRLVKIMAAFILCTLVTNAVRYMTVFFRVTQLTGSVVTSIVMMVFYVVAILLYAQNYFSFARNLPPLLNLLAQYDKRFGTCLDYRAYNLRLKRLIVGWCLTGSLAAFVFSFCFTAFFPSFHQHLAPFTDLHDSQLYVVAGIFAVILSLLITIETAFSLFLNIMTYFLTKEFTDVKSTFRRLLDTDDESASKCVRKGRSMIGDRRKRKTVTSCFTLRKKKFMKAKSICELSKHPQPLSTASRDFEINLAKGIKTGHDHPQDEADVVDTTLSKSQAKVIHHQGSERRSLEHQFNDIRARHEILCAIVKKTQKCLRHILAFMFILGVPVICLVVYGLASGSLHWDECVFLSFVILQTICELCVFIWTGAKLTESKGVWFFVFVKHSSRQNKVIVGVTTMQNKTFKIRRAEASATFFRPGSFPSLDHRNALATCLLTKEFTNITSRFHSLLNSFDSSSKFVRKGGSAREDGRKRTLSTSSFVLRKRKLKQVATILNHSRSLPQSLCGPETRPEKRQDHCTGDNVGEEHLQSEPQVPNTTFSPNHTNAIQSCIVGEEKKL